MAKITSLKINGTDYELSGGGLIILEDTATLQEIYDAFISTGNVRITNNTYGYTNIEYADKISIDNSEYVICYTRRHSVETNVDFQDKAFLANEKYFMIGTPTSTFNETDRVDSSTYMTHIAPRFDDAYDIMVFNSQTAFYNVASPPKNMDDIRLLKSTDDLYAVNVKFIKDVFGLTGIYNNIFCDFTTSLDSENNPIKYHTTPQCYSVQQSDASTIHYVAYFKMLVYLKEDIIGPKTFGLGSSGVYDIRSESPAIEVIDILTGDKLGTCDCGQYFSSGSTFVVKVDEGKTMQKDHPYLITTEPILKWN